MSLSAGRGCSGAGRAGSHRRAAGIHKRGPVEWEVRVTRSRTLIIVGVLLMLLGALDPMEGAVAIVAGSGMAAVGARLGHSRRRAILEWGFGLIVVGVACLIVLSALGGFGGDSGRSAWWGLLLLPYAAGWVTGLTGAALWAADGLRNRPGPASQ